MRSRATSFLLPLLAVLGLLLSSEVVDRIVAVVGNEVVTERELDAAYSSDLLGLMRPDPITSEPVQTLTREQYLEQICQSHPVAAVTAVMGQILRHQVDLSRSLQLQKLRFAHQVSRRKGTMPASHQRDRTKGAAMIAPLAYLEVPHVRARSLVNAHPGMPDDRISWQDAPSLQFWYQARRVGRTEEQIHLGKLSTKLVGVPLYHATHCRHEPAATASLQRRGLQNGLYRFSLGRINETAGVHHDQVRVFR